MAQPTDSTVLAGNINDLTDEFRTRVEELFENTDGVQDMTTEQLARWASEELAKFLVDKEEEAYADDDYYDDREGDRGLYREYEEGPPFPRE